MTNAQLQEELVGLLGLARPPVAITFHDDAGAATSPFFGEPMSEPTADGRTGRVPAGCVFWAHAHDSAFSTVPDDHGNCSVGMFTHGLAPAEDIIGKDDVATLLDVGWVTMEAFGGVASLDRKPAAIEYQPLAEAARTPDVVMLRLSPKQMMELGDSVQVDFSGKPQCQVIPRAAAGAVTASMGCALSRERIGMGDDELTCAIPGNRVAEVVESLRSVSMADAAVVGYAAADKQRFS
jgi:uncharacterized protein (DUF169 family)